MADVFEYIRVANITALKALTATGTPKLVDGRPYKVDDNSAASDGSGIPAFYHFVLGSAEVEALPSVVADTADTGRFFAGGGAGGGVQSIQATSPIGADLPDVVGSEILQVVTGTLNKKVRWYATGLTVNDWAVAHAGMITATEYGSPNGLVTADDAGQFFKDYTPGSYGGPGTNALYIASTAGGTEWTLV